MVLMEILKYDFLILSLLFMIPGFVIYIMRRDLRKVIITMTLIAIPFAFTETFFYPVYWNPKFIFDLGDKIGFGIEDFMFVMGLAAFTSTCYAFIFKKKYIRVVNYSLNIFLYRCFMIVFIILLFLFLSHLIKIHIIYTSVGLMILIPCFITIKRHDLLLPAILGGLLSVLAYFFLCKIYQFIYPKVFTDIWNTGELLNIFLLGVPLEEIIYGFSAGFSGTIIYPYIFNYKFRSW
jgi:hypothetical protein